MIHKSSVKFPNKIRVFIFLDSYHIGGLHRQMLNLVKYINKDIFVPIVCTQTANGELREEFETVGCKLYDLRWKRKFDLSIVHKLVKALVIEGPDIILLPQAQAFFYYRLARLFWRGKIVQIGSFRALNFINGHRQSYFIPLDNLFSKWLLSSSYRVVVNSKALKNHYTQFVKSRSENTIVIINNGSDFSYPVFKLPASIRRDLSLAVSDFIVVMAARLDPWKDFSTLFKAAKIVISKEPMVRFLIIGEGPLRQKLERMIVEMDLHRNMLLVGEKKDIYNYLNVADISVLSTNGEGFSNTILESMSMGKPVVATDVGGNSEVIGDCGFIVPPKSPVLFADAIVNLKRDTVLRNKIGEIAKERVHEMCSINKYIMSYESLFIGAMNNDE